MLDLWRQARLIDPTLKVSPSQLPALRRRQLLPTAFSRQSLFSSMAKGNPVLFSDLRLPVRGEREFGVAAAVFRALHRGFPRQEKLRVRCGPSDATKYLSIDELLRRWKNPRARVSITDLHIRGTKVMRSIDCSRLSDFNLLAEARGEVGAQEMLTMVVSSAGTYTDSHSDDPDGSNHCFTGKKLWLVWDTFAGLSRKLEDVERIATDRKTALFSIAQFLSVPGSRWFVVEAGQTLFLPGHLTHKVITLENYLGIGSFSVMLPSYLRTLVRWSRHTPLWALEAPSDRRLELVDKVTCRVTEKLQALATASQEERSRWGLEFLHLAMQDWQRGSREDSWRLLRRNPTSARFVDAALPRLPAPAG
jgi:hypothetical protein